VKTNVPVEVGGSYVAPAPRDGPAVAEGDRHFPHEAAASRNPEVKPKLNLPEFGGEERFDARCPNAEVRRQAAFFFSQGHIAPDDYA
jgi:hypothetical protein